MSSLLEKLKAGKKAVKTVKFPGTDQDVSIQVLNNSEKQRANMETERYFKAEEISISATTMDIYLDEINTRTLAVALRNPLNVKEPFAASADELRALITTDEKDLLIEEYNALEQEVSPAEKNMTGDQFEDLFATLKKNPTIGNALNLPTLRGLIGFLASRPWTSPKDSGSTSTT